MDKNKTVKRIIVAIMAVILTASAGLNIFLFQLARQNYEGESAAHVADIEAALQYLKKYDQASLYR